MSRPRHERRRGRSFAQRRHELKTSRRGPLPPPAAEFLPADEPDLEPADLDMAGFCLCHDAPVCPDGFPGDWLDDATGRSFFGWGL